MEKKNKKIISNGLLVCGLLLVLCAMGIFLYMQITQNKASRQMEIYVERLQENMPEVREAYLEERNDTVMPIVEVEGQNFVGILEIPLYGIRLPVGGSWEKENIAKYPSRYWGSLYNSSLIIGGNDWKGQLDFLEEISIGDVVCVTDMTGARYSYTVSWVEKTKEVFSEYLEDENVSLTMFARNQYGFDYTVVRCE